MTSSNGNIFRVTGLLCGEFTGPGDFPTQRPVTRSFVVFFDLRLNKRFSKQPWGWWFETPSWSLWRECNECKLNRSTTLSMRRDEFKNFAWKIAAVLSQCVKWSVRARGQFHLTLFYSPIIASGNDDAQNCIRWFNYNLNNTLMDGCRVIMVLEKWSWKVKGT